MMDSESFVFIDTASAIVFCLSSASNLKKHPWNYKAASFYASADASAASICNPDSLAFSDLPCIKKLARHTALRNKCKRCLKDLCLPRYHGCVQRNAVQI